MTNSIHSGPAGRAADAIRALAHAGRSGVADPDLVGLPAIEIVRRAVRGADELLLLLHPEGSWWVARRVDDVARACAYIGDVEADRDFDLFLASPSPRGAWLETAPVPTVALDEAGVAA